MLIVRAFIAVSLLFLVSLPTSADGLTMEQWKIYRSAEKLDEPITEDMHEKFWAPLSEQDREAIRNGTFEVAYFALMDRLDAAYSWSVYETVESGVPTKTSELEAVRNEMMAISTTGHARKQLADQFAEQDKGLDPAALRQQEPDLPQSWEWFETANRKQALAQREAMLLNPTWDDTPRAWPYPPLRLTLSWPHRWDADCGRMPKCVDWIMTLKASETGAMGVRYFNDVPDGAVPLLADFSPLTRTLIDVPPSPIKLRGGAQESQWRGYRSQLYGPVADSKHDVPYRLIRVVLDPERKAAWVITASSTTSLEEAEALFGRLEDAIVLH